MHIIIVNFKHFIVAQHGTPIYNMAAGTCLGVTHSARNAQVVMDLCTKSNTELITWDLVRSRIPSKEIR